MRTFEETDEIVRSDIQKQNITGKDDIHEREI